MVESANSQEFRIQELSVRLNGVVQVVFTLRHAILPGTSLSADAAELATHDDCGKTTFHPSRGAATLYPCC